MEPKNLQSNSFARRVRIWASESKFEIIKTLRLPAFLIPTIAFPVAFYVFFGVIVAPPIEKSPMAKYLLATYGAFGVMGIALFTFGVGVAIERGQGWFEVKRATPMPVGSWFGAKLTLAVVFGAVVLLLIAFVGAVFGHVRMAGGEWLGLFGALLLGVIPLSAFGLVVGMTAGPNSAPAVANLIYLPMSFLSGLWIPIEGLPGILQKVAPAFPPYHVAQLALGAIGLGRGGSAVLHLTVLAAYTLVFLGIVSVAYRKSEGKSFG